MEKGLETESEQNMLNSSPPIIFIKGFGVWQINDITPAMLAQLQCFYGVIIRLDISKTIATLNVEQIEALLDWDAEKYRQFLN